LADPFSPPPTWQEIIDRVTGRHHGVLRHAAGSLVFDYLWIDDEHWVPILEPLNIRLDAPTVQWAARRLGLGPNDLWPGFSGFGDPPWDLSEQER
jgi:hypothetical protein